MSTHELIFTEEREEKPLVFDSIYEHLLPGVSEFQVQLATGDTISFRHLKGRDAFRKLRNAAQRFAEGVKVANAPEAVREFVAEDRSTMIWCHLMAALNLDGGTVWDFLKIQHHAPLVFEDLLESFQTELLHAAEVAETSAIDQAKKE